jgi:hypothetical protein
MASNRLQVTDLDFDTIKTNLKTFLQGQSEFTDYNFEGSGLNVLLDILAYNTHYNAYYLNMVANESFLDSAILRNSVVSHAKLLSYVPQSITSPKAIIDLTVPTASSVPDSLTLSRGFSFKTNIIDNTTYNYVLLEDATVDKVGQDFYCNDNKLTNLNGTPKIIVGDFSGCFQSRTGTWLTSCLKPWQKIVFSQQPATLTRFKTSWG